MVKKIDSITSALAAMQAERDEAVRERDEIRRAAQADANELLVDSLNVTIESVRCETRLAHAETERDEATENARQAVHVVRSSIVAYLRQKATHSVVNGRVLLNLADDLEDFEHTTFVEKLIAERDEARAECERMRKVFDVARRVVSRGIHRRQDHREPMMRNVELLVNDIEILAELARAIDSALAQRSGK